MHVKPFPCTLPPSLQPQSVCSAIKEFVLIPQHTTPTNTTKELDALYDVLQDVKKMWKTEVKVHCCSVSTSCVQSSKNLTISGVIVCVCVCV